MDKMHTAIEKLIAAKRLPEPSSFSLELLRLSRNEQTDIEQFVEILTENSRFSSSLLKYVNGTAPEDPPAISLITEAVDKLGPETIASLSLFCSLLAQYRHGDCSQFDYQRFWQKSLATGIAARSLAAQQIKDSDGLFTYGILSRIGELGLAAAHPKDYGKLLSEVTDDDTQKQAEIKLFGFSAVELTCILLEHWQLPRKMLETINEYSLNCQGIGQPSEDVRDGESFHAATATTNTYSGTEIFKACKILLLADDISRICLLDLPLTQTLEHAEKQSSEHGIPVDQFGPFFDQLVICWHTTSKLFRIPTIHCPDYHQIKTIDEAARELHHKKPPPLTFLAADDDPMTLLYLKKMLTRDDRTLFMAEDGDEAMKLALEHRPHILITDWRMPGLNGIELCKKLRKTKITEHIYIIMLTCNETEDELVQAFNAGADDYVVKPFTPKVLQARISSGERLVVHQQTIHRDRETIQRYAARLATANRKLQNMAMTDYLTGLPNRRNALLRLRNLVAEVKRYGEPLSCLMLDIDHFKAINDTYGHDCGDRVLQQISRLLEETARGYDVVSRWGGEEFLIICGRSGPTDSLHLAERLRKRVERHTIYSPEKMNSQIRVTVSIGVANWNANLDNEDQLIKEADTHLYLAKKNGRNRVEANSD